MIKCIIISVMCSLVSISYATNVCNTDTPYEVMQIQDISKYVNLQLIRPGHEEQVLQILSKNPEKAQILKIIRDKYDALLDKTYEDQGTKYLSFSGSCHTYFEDYAVDILSFIEQEDIYSEYDRAIIDLGLAPHMRKSYEN